MLSVITMIAMSLWTLEHLSLCHGNDGDDDDDDQREFEGVFQIISFKSKYVELSF